MPTAKDDYSKALTLLNKNLKAITPPEKDAASWNLYNALGLLARAIQQDMEETKTRLAAIEDSVSELKRLMPPRR